MAEDQSKALFLLGGLGLVGLGLYLGLKKPSEEIPPEDEVPTESQYAASKVEFVGYDTWYPQGVKLALADGDQFGAKLTFRHLGPGETVFLHLGLHTDRIDDAPEWQDAQSSWVTIQGDAIWKTYTVETKLATFQNPRGVEWDIKGYVALFDRSLQVLLRVPKSGLIEYIYRSAPGSSYESASASFWG